MTKDNVIYLGGRRTGKTEKASLECLAKFISREDYPELFGDESKFDFEVEEKEEKGLMSIEEFNKKLRESKEKE